MEAFFTPPLLALGIGSLIVGGAWLVQRRTGTAALIDPIWSAIIGLSGAFYAVVSDGWRPRRVLIAALIGIWSARLTWHLVHRIANEREDGRYTRLRSTWKQSFQGNLFWFYQAQAVLAVLLTLPLMTLCTSEHEGWRGLDMVAIGLFVASLAGESIADRQLGSFRCDPANKGKTCTVGLWRWSRHPNYFFEWLHWIVYPVLAIGLPWGWTAWFAPALMFFLVYQVTGIPPTEEQALLSRGDDYRRYQKTTNAFFPGPNRKPSDRQVKST
ncbi:MAG: steroid 5-alpha reductase family enzyme [Planctomycetota bacterium]|jgi:steroid 5-alpha reductase family enzyme